MENQIKLKKAPAYRFIPYLLVVLAYCQIYVGTSLVQQAGVQLKEWFSIGDTGLSYLQTVCTVGMGIFELIGALLVRKIGAKKVCMSGMLVYVAAGLLFFLKPSSYGLMFATRLFHGFGSGLMSCCVMSLAIVWFPRKERSLASGFMACMYGMGNLISTNICTQMFLHGFEWNQVFGILLVAMNLAGFLLFLFVYVDIEKKYGCTNIDEIIEGSELDETAEVKTYENKKFTPYKNTREMIRSGSFWTFMVPIFLYCWNVYCLAFVLPILFNEKGFTPEQSAAIQSLTFLGAIIGSPVGGLISDKFLKGRRAAISAIAFIGSVIPLIILPMAINSGASIMTLSMLCLASYLIMHFAAGPQWVMPNEMCTPQFGMVLMGITLIVTKIGGIIGPIVAGYISDTAGSIMGGIWSIVIISVIAGIANFVLARKWGL